MSNKVLFEVKNVAKNFHGNPALKGVSMTVNEGEIIGLVGENGAGKSTLLKIIMGVQPASSGEMILRGQTYAPKTPKEANDSGIGMVFQEQSLITNLTVGQNIYLGEENKFKKLGFIDYKKMYESAQRCLKDVELDFVKPEKYVRDLNFATRQMVEIARAVNKAYSSKHEHALILLDEPTSVLNDAEVKLLYKQMRNLAAKGHSVIFVSHHLDEILEVTDRIYVFRDAENAGEFETKTCDEMKLYEAMVGKKSSNEYYSLARQRKPDDEVVLDVMDLHKFGEFKDVSFQLHKGEILGFCGVVGSGKESLCYVVCGDDKPDEGSLNVKGKAVVYSNPGKALKQGITMIPEERNAEGIFGILDLTDNIGASNLHITSKLGFISNKSRIENAKNWITRLRIKTQSHKTPAESLSGGNAQKVVFAKMLSSDSDIILLNHPTRGVDVGAKVEIYSLIRDMADSGKSVLLLGDTLDECIGMSNRILVMKDGLITGDFDAPADNKPNNLEILKCMM